MIRFYPTLFGVAPSVPKPPQGLRWESFHTHGEATTHYAADAHCGDTTSCAPVARVAGAQGTSACCATNSNRC
jgi:hypothetical protein